MKFRELQVGDIFYFKSSFFAEPRKKVAKRKYIWMDYHSVPEEKRTKWIARGESEVVLVQNFLENQDNKQDF